MNRRVHLRTMILLAPLITPLSMCTYHGFSRNHLTSLTHIGRASFGLVSVFRRAQLREIKDK